MAYSRSEVVLSTEPERLRRLCPPMPESVVESCIRITAERVQADLEVIQASPARRVPPRSQREVHRIFGADE